MNLTVKRGVVGVVMAGALLMGPVVGLAQAQAVQTSAPTAVAVQNAEEVREEFRSVLRQYPPALGRVLLLDPTLLLSQAYLEPYPALRQFLGAHPEVARDPVYFLGHLSQSAWAGAACLMT
jgi:hypothetical protein